MGKRSSTSSTRACGALYSYAWGAQHPAENRRREAGHRGLGANIEIQQIATSTELPEERSRIEAWYNGHQDVAGMFAVDAAGHPGRQR